MGDAAARQRAAARPAPWSPTGGVPVGDARPVRAPIAGRAQWRRSPLLPAVAATLGLALTLALAYLLSPWLRAEVAALSHLLGRGDAAMIGERLRSYGPWAPVASLGLMVAQALVAPIPAFLIVFANGLAFGVWWGWLLSLVGQSLAAAICFWLARALGRGPVESLVGRLGLESADRWFARWGLLGLFLTRLIPGVGFDGVSYAAGLSRMGFATFSAVTLLGSAPQLLLYVLLGQRAPGTIWLLVAATVAVTAVAGGVGYLRSRRRPATTSD